jgi:hypothetical protein
LDLLSSKWSSIGANLNVLTFPMDRLENYFGTLTNSDFVFQRNAAEGHILVVS